MTNRLAHATSPYLLQHADNPIHWWEWSDEAFEEARRRDVPVLLSVGYSACHWCHVMAHESFSDADVARRVNAGFVAVKVDREERPDVDAVYMAATQTMTGRGGWPMTCFLTPRRDPFHCGTYYPPTPRHGTPSFGQVLDAVTRAWTGDGDRVRTVAREISSRLRRAATVDRPPLTPGPDVLAHAVRTIRADFDLIDGGFARAPKFPPALVLEFLLRHHERTGSTQALTMVTTTCAAMARGGIHDQLGGGFARYSVDARWDVPHFEKMLYDNALLLRVYAHLARRTGDALAHRVATGTAEFLVREMRTDEGAFASSLDADTDGVEGLTYTWTPDQIREVLPAEDARWAARLLGITRAGTTDGGTVPTLRSDPDEPGRWAAVRTALLAARSARPQPARDDKVLTAWNGMAILALTEAGSALDRPDWIRVAAEAADVVLSTHVVDGRLRRSSRGRRPGRAAGVLEDHAHLADGLLALHQATAEPGRLDAATRLLDLALDHFAADQPGTYFDTAADAEVVLHRSRDIVDNATASGSSALAGALLTASVLTDATRSARYREVAEAMLESVGEVLGPHARFAGHWLSTAEAVVSGPIQVAVVGPAGSANAEALLDRARTAAPGGAVIVHGRPESPGAPLLANRPLVDGGAAAYVCRGFVCDRPVTTPDELMRALAPK